MKIAISGKGGTGKTTISASLALSLAEDGFRVYAIDADPDANLASLLGIEEKVKPLAELEEIIKKKVGGEGGLFTLNPEVDDVLEDYAVDFKGIKFLQMGGIKKANSSCYCRENSFLKAVIDTLLFEKDEIVIMDMGAGIEHLTRGTSRGVDLMLVVCEPTVISMETAGNVKKLALEAGIPRVGFVGNKVKNEAEREFLTRNLPGEILALIPYDDLLLEKSLTGGQPLVTDKVKELLKQIEKIVG